MFGRKEKKALEGLPPLHRQLVEQHQVTASQTPDQWNELMGGLMQNHLMVHRHPLPPRTVELVIPLLRILCEDVPADGYLGLRLDMTGSGAPGKAGIDQEIPVQKPVRKCLQHFEFDPWLSLEARLSDKSKLDLWVADVVRVRRITKKGSSGKVKTKTKRKATQRLRVRLSVPAARPVAAPAHGVPNWCRITLARDERHVVLDGRSKYPIDPPATVATGLAARFHGPNVTGILPPAGQLNNVLLLVGEVMRWVPPISSERTSA